MVELALLLPIIVLLAFAAVDLARAYAERTTVAAAAESAARAYAATSRATVTTVTAAAVNQDPSSYSANGCSTAVGPAPAAPFGEVQVTVTCTFTPLTPLLKNIVGTPVVSTIAVARTTY